MSTISRRAFLKTVGVGALSVAAMSVLAGCEGLPTGTETVVTGTVAGTVGVPMQVADLLVVSTGSGISEEFKVKEATSTCWIESYVGKYTTHTGTLVKTAIDGVDDYLAATEDQRKEAADAAKQTADAALDKETVDITFNVANYSETPVVLTGSMKDGKLVSDVFTATCNGAAVDCTIGTAASVLTVDGATNAFTCTVTLPVNAEKFELTVALPNAKAVKYTFTNKYYSDLDASKAEFYALKTIS